MAQHHEADTLEAAQAAMRSQYLNGATGIIVSGLVWLTTAFVAYRYSVHQAVWALLVGGALIHPLSTGEIAYWGRKRPAPSQTGCGRWRWREPSGAVSRIIQLNKRKEGHLLPINCSYPL